MPWRETQGFAYAAPVLQWYRNCEFQVQSLAKPELAGSKLVEIAPREIFAEGPKAYSARGDHTVRIISVASEAQEVREIAREVLRLARDDKIPFHEMAVLLSNFDLYAPLLHRPFKISEFPSTSKGANFSPGPRLERVYSSFLTWWAAISGEERSWSS